VRYFKLKTAKEFYKFSKIGYQESPSVCEVTDCSSDIQSNLPEGKLDLPDTELCLLAVLGTPLVSLAFPISVLKLPLPTKLNLLWPSVAATFGCK
jgi:hypothetical protein